MFLQATLLHCSWDFTANLHVHEVLKKKTKELLFKITLGLTVKTI